MYVHFADGSCGPANIPSPIDQAWQTRVPRPRHDVPPPRHDVQESWQAQRAAAREAIAVKLEASERASRAKPFRFEDLEGKPEPESWGPIYNLTNASLEKWRKIARGRELTAEEASAYGQAVHAAVRAANAPRKAPNTLPTSSNCASGQATTFSAAKHRAKLIGELRSAAARDRLAWATSEGIREAYARAMAEKRNRESAIAAAEAVRIGGLEALEAARIARAFGRPLAEAA
jgi:hypothetical protein